MEIVNVLGDEWGEWPWPQPDQYRWRHIPAGRRLGGEKLGGTVYELDPGHKSFPYHWHAGNEEMLIVLSGRLSLRTPEGEREVGRGDVAVFLRGPNGAHQLRNDGPEPARLLMVSTRIAPEAVEYPDSGKVGVSGPGIFRMLRADADIDYWDGEA